MCSPCGHQRNTVLTIWLGVSLTRIKFLGRGYTAFLMFVPALVGAILVNTLQDHNRIGLLFSYWVSSTLQSHLVLLTSDTHVGVVKSSSLSLSLSFWDGWARSSRDIPSVRLPTPSSSSPTRLETPLDPSCGRGNISPGSYYTYPQPFFLPRYMRNPHESVQRLTRSSFLFAGTTFPGP
jgi:hypothetical protein